MSAVRSSRSLRAFRSSQYLLARNITESVRPLNRQDKVEAQRKGYGRLWTSSFMISEKELGRPAGDDGWSDPAGRGKSAAERWPGTAGMGKSSCLCPALPRGSAAIPIGAAAAVRRGRDDRQPACPFLMKKQEELNSGRTLLT